MVCPYCGLGRLYTKAWRAEASMLRHRCPRRAWRHRRVMLWAFSMHMPARGWTRDTFPQANWLWAEAN